MFYLFFLGIQVTSTTSTLHLCQQKHIFDRLHLALMFECKPISTPMAFTTAISLYDSEVLFDPTSYQSIVNMLQYYTITRINISFFVNKVCQFMPSPTIVHLKVIKCILRYLKSTIFHGISF